MAVWTISANGRPVLGIIQRTAANPTPVDHVVVHLVLADGRELRASPGHPLADGRLLGSLSVSDQVDGSSVVSVARDAYGSRTTYDILPSGPTGAYWADGVALGSTIAR
jgi:hypothetical protein